MPKIVHIVPYDGIGGVEAAARSMGSLEYENFSFEVDYIYKNLNAGKTSSLFSPWPIITAAWRIRNIQPDVLIVSLWRSAIVGLIAKALRPRIKLVTFLHNSTNVHFPDLVLTRLAAISSTEVWADSQATLSGRIPSMQSKKCQVISFVTRRFESLPPCPATPSFIFWGRINQQKGLDRAIRFFANIHKRYPHSRFWVIGPDGGALQATQALSSSLGLEDSVTFLGSATHDEIVKYARNASFYLQTSHFEGMAMSVVEAMQLGLVPVVTPVGEIANYCHDGINAVVMLSELQAQEDVIKLLNVSERFQSIRANAIATWENQPLYRDSVLSACQNVLATQSAT